MADPVTTEILKNALATVAEEIGATVVKSSYSPHIKGGADASSAILDDQGQLVSQSSAAFLAHLSSLRSSLRELLIDYPVDQMRDGDVYIMNDPDRGGIHANDMEVFRPFFADGRVLFFAAALVHVVDVGAVTAGGLPAQATDQFQEGLLVPPLPLYREGVLNESVTKIVALNSRAPDLVLGDLASLVSGCNVGAKRLQELVDRYGSGLLVETVREIMDSTERWTRRAISALEPGRYEGEYVIEDDGIDLDRQIHVRVAIETKGSDLVVDFAGTDPQVRGAINAAYSQALSGAIYGVRCALDPEIPMNEGFLRPLDIRLPRGSLVNPDHIAARNARIVTIFAIVDAVLRAFARLDPERAVATSGIVHVLTIDGVDPQTGAPWILMGNEFGGIGARSTKDGVDAGGAYLFAGRGMTNQVESQEISHDHVRVEGIKLVPDSGGPGTWRGGRGVEITRVLLADGQVSVRADRERLPPSGLHGGCSGRPGAWIVNVGRADERVLRSKEMGVPLSAGSTLTLRTPGGGGMGPPWERSTALVVADVEAGVVSREGAERDYGVVLVDGTAEVDEQATTARRRALAAEATP